MTTSSSRTGAPSDPHRLLAGLVIAFLALLTLEWVTVSGFSGGFIKPFHLGILAIGLVALARWRPTELLAPVLRRHGPVFVSYYLVIAVSLAGGLAHRTPYYPRQNAVRQLSYVTASVLLAGVLSLVLPHRRVQRALAWAGLVTALTVSAGLLLALASQNVNPVSLLREALARADPDIISNQLLRDAFRTDEGLAEAGANLRHKVFLAVALSTFVGLAFLPVVSRRHHMVRAVLLCAGVAGSGLVLLSLSRSTMLVLVAPAVLIPLRVFVRGRVGTRQMVVLALCAVVLVGLAVSPLAELLSARFDETRSVESRLEGAGPIFLSLASDAALGGIAKPDMGASPHNLVLDAWLSGGVLAALAATVLLVSLAATWWRVAGGYLRGDGRWALPVEPVWLLGIGFMPLVRAFTAGNQFHMVEWAAIAVFLAVVATNDRLCGARARPAPIEGDPVPHEVFAR